ncbi:Uncharacterised protein [Ectopseudomonas oleovorans]|jgi:hypothetical protein|uniref:Uncharacterized protein n=1 Tax=Ectopseudomonas oleovorans TaxID=301 RepID=A0A379K0A2_ECTOL|nr:Uncharacterised protein [Pseudomonas oleovorans]
MVSALTLAIIVLLVICGCLVRIIYVMGLAEESDSRFQKYLVREIDRAGWTAEYRSAQRAACYELYSQDSESK